MLSLGTRPLLAAKLLVPSPPSGTVARSRLLERLQASRDTRLTVVVAPAGWGKTTLLAAWARDPAEQGRVGWLSLDEADDEPVRFWTYALAALESVAPGMARDALAALGGPGPGLDPIGVALGVLLGALAESQERHVLVLDDYHVLSDPLIQESVESLLAYLPPALHLVIASRTDPALPLARMLAPATADPPAPGGVASPSSPLLSVPHAMIIGGLLDTQVLRWLQIGGVSIPIFVGISAGITVVAIQLAITGRHPQGLYDLFTGVARWVFRAVSYLALLTDVYPPFRLDQGGAEAVEPTIMPATGRLPAGEMSRIGP